MRIEYRRPARPLRPFIRSYYLTEIDDALTFPVSAEIANLRFVLRGASAARLNGDLLLGKDVNLLGPSNASYFVELGAGARIFGAGLVPLGWATFIGERADALADSMIDYSAICAADAKQAGHALDAMRKAGTLDEIASVADDFFLTRLAAASPARVRGFPAAIEAWLHDPSASLDGLVREMGVSHRQIDRLSGAYFGAPPKLLRTKQRAIDAARRLAAGESWTTAAENYYDQSHFIRDFKRFIGLTPRRYLTGASTFAAEIMRRRTACVEGASSWGG